MAVTQGSFVGSGTGMAAAFALAISAGCTSKDSQKQMAQCHLASMEKKVEDKSRYISDCMKANGFVLKHKGICGGSASMSLAECWE